ncbi:YceI family protein [Jatrophihabitans telluris]|uniref:YceI family protein n=1 Tax=Jatrophihabitans telluris TaxID=2038343 RepID=A0ABY4R0B8_9ACTN|nr:YceI family protein [Jatrophihabitans telluris]UQX89155.1 YceI family protein [Jatrophihabitans telluris]
MTATLTDVTGTYTLDVAHSRIGFSARHAMVTKVRGAFNDFAGTIVLDGANPSNSSAELSIQVASIDTRNEQRDGHLRTNDFFDAPSFPEITYKSTSIEQLDEENFRVTGDLTIKGVTKSIVVDWEFAGLATDPYGNVRAGFEGKATLNRTDFGIAFNAALETGGVLVSEKINLEFEVSAIRQAA